MAIAWRSRVIRALNQLDRPGGRSLLAGIGTFILRHKVGPGARIFFDSVWIQQFGEDFVATGPQFAIVSKQKAYDSQFEHCSDFWFYSYEPLPGHVIIDAGAGIGSDTLVFSKSVGDRGRVLAIEAHPRTFSVLERQCRWNDLQNVTLCQCAIVGEDGPVFIQNKPEHEENAVSRTRRPGDLAEAIDGETLDELCRRHGINHVDFLKMNIEGAEALAIEGMKELIGYTDAVCIACHDFQWERGQESATRDRVVAFLLSRDFSVLRRSDDPRDFVRDHVHGYRNR